MTSNQLFSCIKPQKRFSYSLHNQNNYTLNHMQEGRYRPLPGTSHRNGSHQSSGQQESGSTDGTSQGHSGRGQTRESSGQGQRQTVPPAAKRRKTDEGVEDWDDDDDFQLTQKDMESIDVMASQALTTVAHGNTDPGPSRSSFRLPLPVKVPSAPPVLVQHSTPTTRSVRPDPPNMSAVLAHSGNTTGSSSSTAPQSSSYTASHSSSSLRSESSVEIPLGQQKNMSASSRSSSGSSESFSTSFFKSQAMESIREDLENYRQKSANQEKMIEELKEKLYATEGETAILRQNLTTKEEELNIVKQERAKWIGQQHREQSEKEKQQAVKVRELTSQLGFQECEMMKLKDRCRQLEVQLNEAGKPEEERSPVYSPKVRRHKDRSPRPGQSLSRPGPSFPTEESFMSQSDPEMAVPGHVKETRDAETMASSGTVLPHRRFRLRASGDQQSFLSSLTEGGNTRGLLVLLQEHTLTVDTHYFMFDRDQSHLLSPRPTKRLSECKEMLKTSPEKPRRPQQKVVESSHQALANEGFQCLIWQQRPSPLCSLTPPSDSSPTPGTSQQLSPITTSLLAQFQSLPPHDICGLLFLPLISDYLKRYIDLMDHSVARSKDSNNSTPSSSERSIHSSSCDTSLESVTSSLEQLLSEGAVFANSLETFAIEALQILRILCLNCESVRCLLCRKEDFSVTDIAKSPRKRLKLSIAATSDESSSSPPMRKTSNQLLQELLDCSLLDKVFRLANPGKCSENKNNGGRKYCTRVVESSLDVLFALAENAKEENAESLLPALSSSVIVNCLECQSTPSIIIRCVQLLTAMANFNRIVASLCSKSGVSTDICILQYLYDVCHSYIEVLSGQDFLSVAKKVISFLWTIISKHKGGLTILLESDCDCSTQILHCVVRTGYHVMKQYENNKDQATLEVVRDCLSLLNSLERKDSLFMDHLRKVQKEYVLLVCGLIQIFNVDPELYDQELKILSDLWDFDQDDSEVNSDNEEQGMETG